MPQDYMRRAFKASRTMEPIALLDDFVKIITYKDVLYRRVSFFEAIPPHQPLDLGAIAAQTVSARTNIQNLDLNDDEFAQWRFFPLDNAMIRVFLPRGVSKQQLKWVQIGFERNIIYRDPTLVSTELFQWEDQRPAIEGMNFSDYALAACRVVFFGYRFHTEDVATLVKVIDPGGTALIKDSIIGKDEFVTANANAQKTGRIQATSRSVLDLVVTGQIPCTPIQCAGQA